MYDPIQTLAAIDQYKVGILALCSGAMICNYIWFFAAVRKGFRDQTYPIPVVSTLFWLTGDGSVVIRWLSGHNAYDHWYLQLFSASLILTVICELTFLAMVLKFGKKELMPGSSDGAFYATVMAGLAVMIVSWTYLAANMVDPLNITYFYLANMIGPAASAALVMKRGTRAGTSPLIWWGYAAMLSFFYAACIIFYGAPFDGVGYMVFDAVNIASAVAMAVYVARLPEVAAAPEAARFAVQPAQGHPA